MTGIILTPTAVYADMMTSDGYNGIVCSRKSKCGAFTIPDNMTGYDLPVFWTLAGPAHIGEAVVNVIQERLQNRRTAYAYPLQDDAFPRMVDRQDDYLVSLVLQSGRVQNISNGTVETPYEMEHGWIARGSAFEFLNGAMAVGVSPVEALLAAIKYRTDVGGRVQMVSDRGVEYFG